MFGAFINFLVTLTDLALSARLGTVALNAVGNGGLLIIAVSMLGVGLGSGTQILIARKAGADKLNEVGVLFNNALLLMLMLGIPLMLFIKFLIPGILQNIIHQEALWVSLISYTDVRAYSMISFFACQLMIAFYTGIAKTKDLVGFTITVALVNIVLDFLLIFGYGPFPALGVKGAAIASVIAESVGFAYLFGAAILRKYPATFGLFRNIALQITPVKVLLSLSFPLMIQELLSVGSWSVFFFVIERKGEADLAASQVMRNLYYFAMIPAWGLSATVRTYVSNLIGGGRREMVAKTIKTIALCSVGFTALIVISIGLKINWFTLFLSDNPALVEPVSQIFYVVLGVMLLYSVSLILFHSITGAGHTKNAMIIEVIAIGTYLVIAYYLAAIRPTPIHWVWASEFAYFGLMFLLSGLYLRKIKLL